MYKMVAIDLDGTLLNSQKDISEKNRQVISKAVNMGVKVILCSGRISKSGVVYSRMLGINGSVIGCNGGIIKDIQTNTVLNQSCISKEICMEIIDVCKKKDIYFHMYIEDVMYTERSEYITITNWKKNDMLQTNEKIEVRLVEDIMNVVEKSDISPIKFVVISKDIEKLKVVRAEIKDISDVDIMSSDYDNFEVVNKGVSKGKALSFVADSLGIKREEIIAIGDNENDISMIEFAGFGVAMENGCDELIEVCDVITLSNDNDGVAYVFEKYVLN